MENERELIFLTMKKVNAKLTIPKLRTVCKFQQSSPVKRDGDTDLDPSTTTVTASTHIFGSGW